MGLPISTDEKGDSYDIIFVIVNWLVNIVYNKPIKIIIDILSLAKVIIGVVMRHHGFPDSIVINQGLLFTSKFWSLLSYFCSI